MRMHSTRAKPMSISRAARNGNASFDRSRAGQRLHQLARARALDVDLRVARRHVGDERVRVVRDVPAHPRLDVAMRGVGGDDPEALVVELGHREVGLSLPAVVEPLRVRDRAARRRRRCSPQIRFEHAPGVAALDEELRHERHVHEDHALARRAVLALPTVGNQLGRPHESASTCGVIAGWRVPVGAFPAADVAEVRAARREAIVDRRLLRAARGLHRARRVVALVDHAERLDGARAAVLGVRLVRVQAIDVQRR